MSEQVAKVEIALDRVNIEDFTWGDLEDMESQSPTKLRVMLEKYVIVEGISKEKLGDYLRGLSLRQMRELSQAFQQAIMQMSNPVAQNGKN